MVQHLTQRVPIKLGKGDSIRGEIYDSDGQVG